MSLASRHGCAAAFAAALTLGTACSPPLNDREMGPEGSPQRIVSQAVVADEILWDLGVGVRERVIAVSKFADDPRYGARAPWGPRVSRLGPHGEQLIALEPDLVIAASFSTPELRDLLERSGVPTLVLSDFTGFADYRSAAGRIGEAVGAPRAATELVVAFDKGLRDRAARATARGSSVVSWVGGMVAGSRTTFDDAAKAAGLTNAAAAAGIVGHKRIPLERAVNWDPDFFVTACGSAGCEAAADRLQSLPAMGATRAARSGQIRGVDDRILFATGSGMLELVSALVGMAGSTP